MIIKDITEKQISTTGTILPFKKNIFLITIRKQRKPKNQLMFPIIMKARTSP